MQYCLAEYFLQTPSCHLKHQDQSSQKQDQNQRHLIQQFPENTKTRVFQTTVVHYQTTIQTIPDDYYSPRPATVL